jgi:hypothetical protein
VSVKALDSETQLVRALRRMLLIVLAIGLVGSSAELLLLQHTEDGWQWIPLVLMAAAALTLVWLAVSGSAWSVMTLQVLMACFVAAGALGVALHYRANVEFQREIDPSVHGLDLLWRVMEAKTPPALAPGTMVQMGLIGLIATYRHPARQWLAKPGRGA